MYKSGKVTRTGGGLGDEFGKWEVPNMGNDAGDDVGKSVQESR